MPRMGCQGYHLKPSRGPLDLTCRVIQRVQVYQASEACRQSLCVERGSTKAKGKSLNCCVYLHFGDNPYDLMRDVFSAVHVHLGTFRLLEERTLVDCMVSKA